MVAYMLFIELMLLDTSKVKLSPTHKFLLCAAFVYAQLQDNKTYLISKNIPCKGDLKNKFRSAIAALEEARIFRGVTHLKHGNIEMSVDRDTLSRMQVKLEHQCSNSNAVAFVLTRSAKDIVSTLSASIELLDDFEGFRPGERDNVRTPNGIRLMRPQRFTLAVLAYLSDEAGKAIAANGTLAKLTGSSKKAIGGHIKAFRKLHLLTRYASGFSGAKFINGRVSRFQLNMHLLRARTDAEFEEKMKRHLGVLSEFPVSHMQASPTQELLDNPIHELLRLLPVLADARYKDDRGILAPLRTEIRRHLTSGVLPTGLYQNPLVSNIFLPRAGENLNSALTHLTMELEDIVIAHVVKQASELSSVNYGTALFSGEKESTANDVASAKAISMMEAFAEDIKKIITTKYVYAPKDKSDKDNGYSELIDILSSSCIQFFNAMLKAVQRCIEQGKLKPTSRLIISINHRHVKSHTFYVLIA